MWLTTNQCISHTRRGHSSKWREARNLYQFPVHSPVDHTWLLRRTRVQLVTPLGYSLVLVLVCLTPRYSLSARLQRILCLSAQAQKCSWLSLPSRLASVSYNSSDRGSCLSSLTRLPLLLRPYQPRSLRSALKGPVCTSSSSAGPFSDFGTTASICCQRLFLSLLRFHSTSTARLLVSCTSFASDFGQLPKRQLMLRLSPWQAGLLLQMKSCVAKIESLRFIF